METDLISYNLQDRDRAFRGVDRDFNIPVLCDSINGGSTQERVSKGDMIGFYGHQFREKYGLYPPESVMIENKVAYLEPAIKTTHLKAHNNGTVEHRAKFLDTDAGRYAKALYQSKTGGFSSAIDTRNNVFAGFDVVFEPNFSSNRGYALDSVEGLTDDQREFLKYQDNLSGMLALLDSVRAEEQVNQDKFDQLKRERDLFFDALSNQNINPKEVLDSSIDFDAVAALERASDFKSVDLERVETVNTTNTQRPAAAEALLRRYGG